MTCINMFTIMGYLGKDLKERKTAGGKIYTFISVATTEKVKEGNVVVDKTRWNSITLWGNIAVYALANMSKGSRVHVTGTMETVSKKDTKGQTTSKTFLTARGLINLSPKVSSENGGSTGDQAEDFDENDIPF